MANEKRLTKADEVALYAIKEFIKENGYPPTVRELCKITGKSSTASIQYRLKSLEQKGYIKTTTMGKRTIRITDGVDAVEVVHGKWQERRFICMDSEVMLGYRCSRCMLTFDAETNYCPYCGAKMDGGNVDG